MVQDDADDPWKARISGQGRHADDVRTDYEVDHARIVHSGSFRRLQGKTQILALGDDDFYRTRLTHSLEVGQVAEGIAQHLRASAPCDDVVSLLADGPLLAAVSLAHDLGHPPFGHGGELALNYCMRSHGGFEGNAQTLRILTSLEDFSTTHGADLTRRALLGVLKYPVRWTDASNVELVPRLWSGATAVPTLDARTCVPPKAYYDEDAGVVEWITAPLCPDDRALLNERIEVAGRHSRASHKSFDCTLMDLADDVAYGVHDLEDAVAIGLVDEAAFRRTVPESLCEPLVSTLEARPLPGGGTTYDALVTSLFGEPCWRKRTIGRLVHYFLRNARIDRLDVFMEPLLRYRVSLDEDARPILDGLQRLIVTEVIDSARVQQLEFKGRSMVVSVFEALASDPGRLLPRRVLSQPGGSSVARLICDHVASLTDGALLKTYERLFTPRMGSVFDRL